jgi:8-oxo-dGTP pyrophosphatase MutT (NUDIX family)
MPQTEKSAGVVVFRREGKKTLFLLLFKKYKSEYWDLVKGRIEKGEEMRKTAVREAAEEAGLTDLNFVPDFEHTMKWWYRRDGKLTRKTVTYFLAETATAEVRISEEHLKCGWFTPAEAEKLIKHKDTRELLKKAQAFLAKQ